MALSEDTLSKFSGHLSAYESACEEDPSLKSFNSSLQQRTTKLIESLTAQTKTGSLSHMDVYGYLLEVNQVVANLIIESEEDMWENQGIRSMAKAYLDSTFKTLEFFNTIEKYVNKAELSQLMIQCTVEQFVKDSDVEGNRKKKYENALEELSKFKGVEDPFDDGEFVTLFELVKKQQIFLLEEVSKLKEKLDKEYSKVHKCKIFSNVVFAAVFVSAVVASVVSLGIGAPLVVAAVAAGLSLTIAGGIWVKSMFKEYKKAAESHKDSYPLLENNTKIVKNEATESINIKVKGLITKISSILETAMETKEEEEETKLALEEIEKRVEGFTEKINEFGETAAKCRKLIVAARSRAIEQVHNLKGKRCLVVMSYHFIVDMLIVEKNLSKIQELKKQISKSFAMKDLGVVKQIIGIRIVRDIGWKLIHLS